MTGSWAEAAKPRQQWRPRSRTLSASEGVGQGIHRRKSLRVREATVVGAPCVERALGASGPAGASWLAPGRDRKRQWPGRSTCHAVDNAAWRFRLTSRRPPTGTNEHWPQLATVAPTTSSLEAGDAVRGYPAPAWKSRPDACMSVLANGRRRKRGSVAREPPARGLVGGSGARDNKSVADTGKRHLPCGGLTALRRGTYAAG